MGRAANKFPAGTRPRLRVIIGGGEGGDARAIGAFANHLPPLAVAPRQDSCKDQLTSVLASACMREIREVEDIVAREALDELTVMNMLESCSFETMQQLSEIARELYCYDAEDLILGRLIREADRR